MKRIKITRSNGSTAWAEKPSDEAAAWLAQGIAECWWGKPERWVREGDEDISAALETRQVDVDGQIVTEYKLAAQFTVVEQDITAEVEAEKKKQEDIKQLKQKLKGFKKSDLSDANKVADALLDLLKALDLK